MYPTMMIVYEQNNNVLLTSIKVILKVKYLQKQSVIVWSVN